MQTIYRTQDCLLKAGCETIAEQVVETLLWAYLEGDTSVPSEHFFPLDQPIDDNILREFRAALCLPMVQCQGLRDQGRRMLPRSICLNPVQVLEAMHFVGLYTDLSQVPEGIEAVCLTEEGKGLLETNGEEAVVEYLIASIGQNADGSKEV